MTDDAIGSVRARADLHLVADGVEASITGDGTRMTLHTSDTPALVATLLAALPVDAGARLGSARFALKRAASALEGAGLSLELVQPGGTVAHIGANCHSRLAHLVLGTPNAEFGSSRVIGSSLAGYVGRSARLRGRAYQAVAGVVVAAVLVAGVRRRRGR